MSNFPDYYRMLGIPFESNDDIIKKAFRKLALRYHPDVNHALNAHEEFIRLYEAYSVLINSNSRKEYDFEYKKYVLKKQVISFATFENEDIKNTIKYSKEQGASYSKMPIDDFLREIGLFGSELIFHLSNSLMYFIGYILIFSGFGLFIVGAISNQYLYFIISIFLIYVGVRIMKKSTTRWTKWDKENN